MFQPRIRGFRSACLAVLVVACASIPSTARAESLADDLPRLMKLGGIPGVSVAVIRGDSVVWSDAFGVRNQRVGEPVNQQTVFEAASLSKTVFAYLVLKLADRNVLDLDTPLFRYTRYPRLESDSRHCLVTARMSLSQTSGLPNWGTQFVAEPGSRFTYSGEGIRFLRRAVEEITGLTLEDLARREVFVPLGMSRSSFLWRDDFAANHATGHDDQGRPQVRRECPLGSAAASLRTTASDYARFLLACLRGEGLSRSMAAQMFELQVRTNLSGPSPARDRLGWSLGWGLMDDTRGRVIWQWGDNGDAVALAVGCPGEGCGLVYFANSATGLSVAHELVAQIMPQPTSYLDALGYPHYDGPERLRWYETLAQQAMRVGRLKTAADLLRFLLELSPGHPWAGKSLEEVLARLAVHPRSATGHG